MPPNSGPVSSLKITPPPNRNSLQTADLWLQDKQQTDGAEGLWRIHNSLYDVTTFISIHPGGRQWLELTKGTDVTEAFETHHLTDVPSEIVKKYFVREAKSPRNAPFTFKPDGFYRTLKTEIQKALKDVPKSIEIRTAIYTDLLLVATIFGAILTAIFNSLTMVLVTGILLACLTIAAHNYFHKKDNFRMYYFNLSLYSHREWRVSHALSHHLHTNTIDDMEITSQEPMFLFLPMNKSFLRRFITWALFPLFWIVTMHLSYFRTIFNCLHGKTEFHPHQMTPFVLPTIMYLFGHQQGFFMIFYLWNLIIFVASTYFAMVGFTAAHHHPDIFHDGDVPRSDTDYDWGLSQLDSIMDRKEIIGLHFFVLTLFGDHCLHHLFPTIDHGSLRYLYPVFYKVCKQFNVNLRTTTLYELFKGAFQQLTRTKINENPPDLLKEY